MPVAFSLSELPFFLEGRAPGLQMNGVVRVSDLHVPFRFVWKVESSRLVVLYNGAVDRSVKPDGVVFQRTSWVPDYPFSVLSLADPTLTLHEGLSLGWGQLRPGDQLFGDFAATIVESFDEILHFSSCGPIIHAGSSAGGFQAMTASICHPGSLAWVNNAQFDWTLYDSPNSVLAAARVAGYDSLGGLRQAAPWRHNIQDFLSCRSGFLEIYYAVNLDSPQDSLVQLPICERLLASSSTNVRGRIDTYNDIDSAHNPLQRKDWDIRLLALVRETESSSNHVTGDN